MDKTTFSRIWIGIAALLLLFATGIVAVAAPNAAYADDDGDIMCKAYVTGGNTVIRRGAGGVATFQTWEFDGLDGPYFVGVDEGHSQFISGENAFFTVHGAFPDTAGVRYKCTSGYVDVGVEVGLDLSSADVKLLDDSGNPLPSDGYLYDGTEKKPVPQVKLFDTRDQGWELEEGQEYTVSYSDNKDAGTATVTITAIDGNKMCKGSTEVQFTIRPVTVTVSDLSAINKTYDGNDQAYFYVELAKIDGVLEGDNVSVDPTSTGTFKSKDVGTEIPVTIGELRLAGAQGGNYVVDADKSQKMTKAEIWPKGVQVSGITGMNKMYDGDTYAMVDCSKATFAGMAEGDELTATAKGEFENPYIGTNKVVKISDIKLGGASVGNYYLTYEGQQATTTANIFKDELTGEDFVPMYRLYNPNSGEHFYTAKVEERDAVVKAGWDDEGVGWLAPTDESIPVYRLYNQYGGEHHYTMDPLERDMLVGAGWNDEGIGWYSDPAEGIALLREYNPYAFACNHNYTTDQDEHDYLVSLGWVDEGKAWFAVGYGMPKADEV